MPPTRLGQTLGSDTCEVGSAPGLGGLGSGALACVRITGVWGQRGAARRGAARRGIRRRGLKEEVLTQSDGC